MAVIIKLLKKLIMYFKTSNFVLKKETKFSVYMYTQCNCFWQCIHYCLQRDYFISSSKRGEFPLFFIKINIAFFVRTLCYFFKFIFIKKWLTWSFHAEFVGRCHSWLHFWPQQRPFWRSYNASYPPPGLWSCWFSAHSEKRIEKTCFFSKPEEQFWEKWQ